MNKILKYHTNKLEHKVKMKVMCNLLHRQLSEALQEDIKKLLTSYVKTPHSDKPWFESKVVNIRGKSYMFTRLNKNKKWKRMMRLP